MEDATTRKTVSHAFVLDIEAIDKLYSLLKARVGDTKIELRCDDGVERRFASPSKLAAFENSKDKNIKEIYVRARADDWKKEATVSFDNSEYSTISINITAREDVLLRLKDSILEIVSGTKAWYSRIARLDFTMVLLFLLVFAIALANFTVAVGWYETNGTGESDSNSSAVFNTIIIGIFAVGFIANKLRKYLFPIGEFLIGQGIGRYAFREKIRWVVIVGFAVSFFASASIAFLQ